MLADLPVELLELISEHLGADDLLSWRYTCRNAYSASMRPFNRRFIEERPFIFENPDSMQRLVEIVRDPAKRKHLKTISLLLASLVDQDEHQRLVRATANQQGSPSSRALRQMVREQTAVHAVLYASEDRFRTTGAPITLIQVLQAMQSQGVDVGIRITDDVGIKTVEEGFQMLDGQPIMVAHQPENPPAWGYDRICDKLGMRDCLMAEGERYETNWINAFRAVQQAKLAPSTLELGNLYNPVNVGVLDSHWLRFQGEGGTETPFRNLTQLRLTLSVDQEGSTPPVSETARDYRSFRFSRSLRTALLHAPQLQTLGLTIGVGAADDRCLGQATFRVLFSLGDKALMALRTLELEGHRVNVRELCVFVAARRATLRAVRLRWIANCETEWPQLERSRRFEEGVEDVGSNCRKWMERTLGKGAVEVWERVYDGKPWFRSERLEARVKNAPRTVPYG